MAIQVGTRVKCGNDLGVVEQMTPQEDPPDVLCIVRFDVRPNAPEWKSIGSLTESNAAPQQPELTTEQKLAAAELELSDVKQQLLLRQADLSAAQTALQSAQAALQTALQRIAELEQPPPP